MVLSITTGNYNSISPGKHNYIRLTCCGAAFCISCNNQMRETALKTKIKFTCPLCRSPPVKNDKEDFDRSMKHASLGRPWALHHACQFYFLGESVPQCDIKGFELCLLAADKGHATSQYTIGVCYRNGQGCKQSFEQAFKYFNLAAAQGMSMAQNNVGACYKCGEGVEKSVESAFKWYTLSAENGFGVGQFNLGYCYYDGSGVEKNYEKVAHFFGLAADQGLTKAQYHLAIFYGNGHGVKQSIIKAIHLFRQLLKDNKDEDLRAEARDFLDKALCLSNIFCASCFRRYTKLSL